MSSFFTALQELAELASSLEIHKRQGDLPSVAKQEQLNTMLHRAWERARERDARGSIALRSVITT